MQATRQPYELLVRWRADGTISGHVQWATVVTDDDGVAKAYPEKLEPVALKEGEPGFPVADILSAAQIAALDSAAKAEARATTAETERDAALAAKRDALLDRDRVAAERDTAKAQRVEALTERNQAITERDQAIVERDRAIVERDAALAERDVVVRA
jgi:hypothetical protein